MKNAFSTSFHAHGVNGGIRMPRTTVTGTEQQTKFSPRHPVYLQSKTYAGRI